EVERLLVLEIGGDAPDAEAEAAAQHRDRQGAAENGAGFVRRRLAAVLVVADLDDGEPDAERSLDVEKASAGEAIGGRRPRRLVDRLPELAREGCLAAIEVVHLTSP